MEKKLTSFQPISVTLENRLLQLTWRDGRQSRYNQFWLRDNCACAICGDHESGNRFQLWTQLPDQVSVQHMKWDDSHLHIVWDHQEHRSSYSLQWLRRHCNEGAGVEASGSRKVYWNHQLPRLPSVDFRQAERDDSALFALFDSVYRFGVVVVKHLGTDPVTTAQLTRRLGYVRNTHFGPITDLQLRVQGKHLSDFPVAITPHTDETYRATPTGINIFHCITPSADAGGVTSITDSHACARHLQQIDPQAYALLCQTPVRHARRSDNELIASHHPPFLLDAEGHLSEVRLNERTMAAIRVAPEKMDTVYAALRQALQIAYSEAFTIRYAMQAGDALVFDNLRVLHARSSFHAKRWIRQTNVVRDEFYARHAYLAEQLSLYSREFPLENTKGSQPFEVLGIEPPEPLGR